MKPQPVVDRLTAELRDLQTKAGLLKTFVDKGMPNVSTEAERRLLHEQLALQERYIAILQQRLALP